MTSTGAATPAVFLYDGDCAFCSTSARFIERRIHTHARVLPWQFTDIAALGVTAEEAETAVIWSDGTRKVAGPEAISVLLRDAGSYWRPLGVVLGLRPVLMIAWPLYRWVARNRHRLPGGTAACSLPQAARDEMRAAGQLGAPPSGVPGSGEGGVGQRGLVGRRIGRPPATTE